MIVKISQMRLGKYKWYADACKQLFYFFGISKLQDHFIYNYLGNEPGQLLHLKHQIGIWCLHVLIGRFQFSFSSCKFVRTAQNKPIICKTQERPNSLTGGGNINCDHSF